MTCTTESVPNGLLRTPACTPTRHTQEGLSFPPHSLNSHSRHRQESSPTNPFAHLHMQLHATHKKALFLSTHLCKKNTRTEHTNREVHSPAFAATRHTHRLDPPSTHAYDNKHAQGQPNQVFYWPACDDEHIVSTQYHIFCARRSRQTASQLSTSTRLHLWLNAKHTGLILFCKHTHARK